MLGTSSETETETEEDPMVAVSRKVDSIKKMEEIEEVTLLV